MCKDSLQKRKEAATDQEAYVVDMYAHIERFWLVSPSAISHSVPLYRGDQPLAVLPMRGAGG